MYNISFRLTRKSTKRFFAATILIIATGSAAYNLLPPLFTSLTTPQSARGRRPAVISLFSLRFHSLDYIFSAATTLFSCRVLTPQRGAVSSSNMKFLSKAYRFGYAMQQITLSIILADANTMVTVRYPQGPLYPHTVPSYCDIRVQAIRVRTSMCVYSGDSGPKPT